MATRWNYTNDETVNSPDDVADVLSNLAPTWVGMGRFFEMYFNEDNDPEIVVYNPDGSTRVIITEE